MINKGTGTMERKPNGEWRSLFDIEAGVGTGMEVDEAFAIVLELAREQAGDTHSDEYNETVEALGIVERVRFYIEKNGEQ